MWLHGPAWIAGCAQVASYTRISCAVHATKGTHYALAFRVGHQSGVVGAKVSTSPARGCLLQYSLSILLSSSCEHCTSFLRIFSETTAANMDFERQTKPAIMPVEQDEMKGYEVDGSIPTKYRGSAGRCGQKKYYYQAINTESCSRPTRHGHAWEETGPEGKTSRLVGLKELPANSHARRGISSLLPCLDSQAPLWLVGKYFWYSSS